MMFINFSLLNEIFRGFYIQRWNDRIRPMDLIEMDKHAHKMMIAYCLGKYEEADGKVINWDIVIKHGIYELIRRIIISDIKSPIYAEVRKNKAVFKELNNYIFKQLEPKIDNDVITKELREFLFSEGSEVIEEQILEAAHIYSSYWEFQIIRQSNPFGYQNIRLETDLLNRIDNYKHLIGIQKITNRHTIANFIDLTGQLRFQLRWAQVPRTPQTSVLGHSLLVAIISYFFSLENGACIKRIYNNFFGGLFHDLPEAVTRDIISPIKRSSSEFDKLIKDLEMQLAENEIFPLIEREWIDEIKYFIIDEFENKILIDDKIISEGLTTDDLNEKYNMPEFNPIDGVAIRAADHLTAFLEAWSSCSVGIKTEELVTAAQNIKDNYKDKKIGKVNIKNLYSNFRNVF
ncbi:MAG: HD domain-containing protein [Candidatus Kapabacteria bacterium]|nr:HD domain-containing protein [Ignavibacteriota bacterium]MCW5886102.1 HD domain-containing protein [Candidatus Kapabacteria bacterium]